MWRLRECFLQKSFFCSLCAIALVETLIVMNFTSCPGHYCAVGGNKMDQWTFNLQYLLKQSTRDLGTKLSSWWLLSSPGWDWLLSSVQNKTKQFWKGHSNLYLQISFLSFFIHQGYPVSGRLRVDRSPVSLFQPKDFFSIRGQRNYQTTWLKNGKDKLKKKGWDTPQTSYFVRCELKAHIQQDHSHTGASEAFYLEFP